MKVAGLVLAAWAPVLAASPVVDDEALSRGFVAKLGALVDAGGVLEADEAGKRLEAAPGAIATPPESAAGRAIVPAGELYDAVLPAVVAIGSVYTCDRCNQWHLGGLASGWIVSPDGLVATNHHVLERETGHRFGAMTSDGEVYAITEIVAADPAGDAAVVRVDGRGREFSCVAPGPAPACGAAVRVISHPKGRFYCLTEGVVSRYHRMRRRDPAGGAKDGLRPAVWMSVTADYAVGSSGGPVFDPDGRVVGMVSRTATLTSAPQSGPTGPTNPHDKAPPEQMIFKDCVSAETLHAILGLTAADAAPGTPASPGLGRPGGGD